MDGMDGMIRCQMCQDKCKSCSKGTSCGDLYVGAVRQLATDPKTRLGRWGVFRAMIRNVTFWWHFRLFATFSVQENPWWTALRLERCQLTAGHRWRPKQRVKPSPLCWHCQFGTKRWPDCCSDFWILANFGRNTLAEKAEEWMLGGGSRYSRGLIIVKSNHVQSQCADPYQIHWK